MKLLKLALVLAALLLIAVAVAVGLALTPGIQTWAVRKVGAGQPGLQLEVDRLAVGLSRTEIRGLRLVQDGAVVRVGELDVSYSGWGLMLGRRIDLGDARVSGLVVDLRSATPAVGANAPSTQPEAARPGSAAPTPSTTPAPAARSTGKEDPTREQFRGLFDLLSPPLPFSVRSATVEGRILLPDRRTAVLTLEATGIAPGATGQVRASVDFSDETPDAPVQTAQVRASGSLRSTTDGRFDRLAVNVTLAARGPSLPQENLALQLEGSPTADGSGESFNLSLGLVRGAATQSLLAASATYRISDRSLAGSWELTAASGTLAPLLTALGLPELGASGNGSWSALPETGAASATGTVAVNAKNLGALSPALAAAGAIDARTSFDIRLKQHALQIERLTLSAEDATGRPIVEVSALQPVSLDLTTRRPAFPRPDTPLARIAVRALPLAWLQPLAGPLEIVSGDLSVALSVEASADGARAGVRAVEPLTVSGLTLRREGRALVDGATLRVEPKVDYTPESVALGLERLILSLPGGDRVEGNATATMGPLSEPLAARFTARLAGRGISAHEAFLPLRTGPLEFGLALAGEVAPATLRLGTLDLKMARQGAGSIVEASLTQLLAIDLASGTPSAGQPDRPVARLVFGEVPATWANAFLSDGQLEGMLSGGVLEVGLRGKDDLSVTTVQPLGARGLGFRDKGQVRLSGVDGSVNLAATWRSGLLAYDLRSLELSHQGAPMSRLVAKGEARFAPKLAVSAAGALEADLPVLLRQPLLTGSAALRQGSARLDFDVGLADGLRGKASLNARDLTPSDPAAPKGSLTASADVSLDATGAGTIRLPLLLEVAGRKSDVALDARLARRGDGLLLEGRLTGQQVIVNDLLALTALVPSSPAPQGGSPARTPGPARDAEPFWKGVTGRLDLDLKRVLYGEDYPINDVRGALVVSSDRISIEGKEGRLKESPFELAGTLTFDPAQTRPYALNGRTRIAEVDVGALLRAANPKEKPSIETRASVAARFSGTGATLDRLLAGLTGEFDLTGNEGVLRALGRRGQTIGTASALVGLVGALRGSDTTVAVAELASALNELRFDRFKIRVERGADMSLNVSSIEFLSPTARITGSGGIRYQEGVSLLDQALRFDLQLAGKDSLALLLQRAGVLGGEADAQGFYAMTSKIALGGTPANPDASQFWRLIGQAALGGLLR